MRTVAIAIFQGVQALDVAGPVDVFAEANGFVPPSNGYEITLVGPQERIVRASNGTRLVADISFDEADRRYGTALVAGGPALPVDAPDLELTAWLVDVASHCERYGSICTGAFALGHAGLLDGHDVTTHWQNAPRLAASFRRFHARASNWIASICATGIS